MKWLRAPDSASSRNALDGFPHAFLDMRWPVDHLEIRNAPIGQEVRPWLLAMVVPDPEQRYAMVYLSFSQESPPGFVAAPLLKGLQETKLAAWRGPELPGRNAAGVPACVPVVAARAPEIAVPAEAENWLAADAAMTWALGEFLLTIGCRWRAKARRQARSPLAADPP